MQYSLSAAVLFALAFGTTHIHSSPMKGRDVGQMNETITDVQDWANDILKVNAFIENVNNLSPSDLATQGAAIVQTFADEHTRGAQLNSDLPGNTFADQEFNGIFNSVLTAFQNIRNSGESGRFAQQSDIDTALKGLCGPVNDAANQFFDAAGSLLFARPPSNCP